MFSSATAVPLPPVRPRPPRPRPPMPRPPPGSTQTDDTDVSTAAPPTVPPGGAGENSAPEKEDDMDLGKFTNHNTI